MMQYGQHTSVNRNSQTPDGSKKNGHVSTFKSLASWAKLLARVFALDITRCRTCGGRMRVLEVVSDPDAIARILHGARAPPAPPPLGQVLLFP